MNRTETLADIRARFPAIPASVAEKHWRKSEAYLRMLNRKYAAHSGDGTLTRFVRDVAQVKMSDLPLFERLKAPDGANESGDSGQ